MSNELMRDHLDLFRGAQRKPTIVILSSCLLICLWRTIGSQSFYHRHLADSLVLADDPVATAAWYHIFMCLGLLGVAPALIIKLLFREDLSSYGLTPGRIKLGLTLVAISLPLLLAIGYLNAPNPDVRAEYPLNRHAGSSAGMFAVHAMSLVLFYIGWEFHFRGYLQFGLAPSLGPQNSIWVQVLASCLTHLGKPTGELFASIPGGLFWGVQAHRTQSLLAGFLQHWLLGVAADYFIVAGGA